MINTGGTYLLFCFAESDKVYLLDTFCQGGIVFNGGYDRLLGRKHGCEVET